MFQNTSDSKYQLVGVGDLVNPGSCLGCGNGTCENGYINLAVSYDYEGQQYLCWTCVVEIAEIIGCMIPDEVNKLKEVVFETSEQNALLRSEVDNANERLAAYDVVLRGAGVSITPAGGVVGIPVSEQPEITEPATNPSVEGQPEEQPVTPEPVKVTGSDDVSKSEPSNTDITDSGRTGFSVL